MVKVLYEKCGAYKTPVVH